MRHGEEAYSRGLRSGEIAVFDIFDRYTAQSRFEAIIERLRSAEETCDAAYAVLCADPLNERACETYHFAAGVRSKLIAAFGEEVREKYPHPMRV